MPKRENAQAIPAKRKVLALLGILYDFFFIIILQQAHTVFNYCVSLTVIIYQKAGEDRKKK